MEQNPVIPTETNEPKFSGIPVDLQYQKELRAKVANLLKWNSDNFPGSQPVSFTKEHLTKLENEDYFVTEKSDGLRYLMMLMTTPKGPAAFMIDRKNVFHYVQMYFPVPNGHGKFHNETILDGELVVDTEGDKKLLRYLVFDLISVGGVSIAQRSFSTRLGILQQDIIKPHQIFLEKHPEIMEKQKFFIEMKTQERSYGLTKVLESVPHLKHVNDGLIFTPVRLPYFPGTCQNLMKWKPAELNTIDFKIKVIRDNNNKPSYQLYTCSNSTHKFHEFLTLETELLEKWRNSSPEGKIGEFCYDKNWHTIVWEVGYAPSTKPGGWKFLRFRDDKDTANDESVMKRIWESIVDGVTKEQLLASVDKIRANWKARERSGALGSIHEGCSTASLDNSLLLSPTSLTLGIPPATPVLEATIDPIVSSNNGLSNEKGLTKQLLDTQKSSEDSEKHSVVKLPEAAEKKLASCRTISENQQLEGTAITALSDANANKTPSNFSNVSFTEEPKEDIGNISESEDYKDAGSSPSEIEEIEEDGGYIPTILNTSILPIEDKNDNIATNHALTQKLLLPDDERSLSMENDIGNLEGKNLKTEKIDTPPSPNKIVNEEKEIFGSNSFSYRIHLSKTSTFNSESKVNLINNSMDPSSPTVQNKFQLISSPSKSNLSSNNANSMLTRDETLKIIVKERDNDDYDEVDSSSVNEAFQPASNHKRKFEEIIPIDKKSSFVFPYATTSERREEEYNVSNDKFLLLNEGKNLSANSNEVLSRKISVPKVSDSNALSTEEKCKTEEVNTERKKKKIKKEKNKAKKELIAAENYSDDSGSLEVKDSTNLEKHNRKLSAEERKVVEGKKNVKDKTVEMKFVEGNQQSPQSIPYQQISQIVQNQKQLPQMQNTSMLQQNVQTQLKKPVIGTTPLIPCDDFNKQDILHSFNSSLSSNSNSATLPTSNPCSAPTLPPQPIVANQIPQQKNSPFNCSLPSNIPALPLYQQQQQTQQHHRRTSPKIVSTTSLMLSHSENRTSPLSHTSTIISPQQPFKYQPITSTQQPQFKMHQDLSSAVSGQPSRPISGHLPQPFNQTSHIQSQQSSMHPSRHPQNSSPKFSNNSRRASQIYQQPVLQQQNSINKRLSTPSVNNVTSHPSSFPQYVSVNQGSSVAPEHHEYFPSPQPSRQLKYQTGGDVTEQHHVQAPSVYVPNTHIRKASFDNKLRHGSISIIPNSPDGGGRRNSAVDQSRLLDPNRREEYHNNQSRSMQSQQMQNQMVHSSSNLNRRNSFQNNEPMRNLTVPPTSSSPFQHYGSGASSHLMPQLPLQQHNSQKQYHQEQYQSTLNSYSTYGSNDNRSNTPPGLKSVAQGGQHLLKQPVNAKNNEYRSVVHIPINSNITSSSVTTVVKESVKRDSPYWSIVLSNDLSNRSEVDGKKRKIL